MQTKQIGYWQRMVRNRRASYAGTYDKHGKPTGLMSEAKHKELRLDGNSVTYWKEHDMITWTELRKRKKLERERERAIS